MSHFEECFWEGNGFDELHKYMKNGTDFCKDFESVLADKADLESTFVKGMLKVLKKAKAASRRCVGSMEPAWGKLVALLEAECEAHRTLSAAIVSDCTKTMKTFTDQQIKSREPMEAAVDRTCKQHADKLSKQMKSKKATFKSCKELETSWEQLKDLKSSRPAGDKDAHKLEKNCRKMEEALMKVDREYRESNIKTEQARFSWETSMYQCCKNNENLEQQRLQQVHEMFNLYSDLLTSSMPPVQDACQELMDTAAEISPEGDVELACTTHGTGPNQPVQTLLDVYEEDMRNVMDSERRQASLERKLQYIEHEIERQQKARSGVEQLAKVYEEQPDFVDEKGAEDVNRQLVEADCMLNLLKANHYKLLSSHSEVSGGPRPSSQFEDFINTTTDKSGTTTTLKIPLDQIGYLQDDYQPANYERSPSTKVRGGNHQHSTKSSLAPPVPANGAVAGGGEWDEDQVEEGFRQDEFNEQDDGGYNYVGQCKVLYVYQANETDELNINPEDVIQIIDKYDQEWWQGELNGTVGIFPASYVEEI